MNERQYHYREDEPDMRNPDTALDMFYSQVHALPSIEALDENIQAAGNHLATIQQWAAENGVENLPEMSADVWHKFLEVRKFVHQQTAALTGAGMAVAAFAEIRREYAELVEAIENMSESHPALAEYAQELRSDEAGDVYDDAYDVIGERVWDLLLEEMQHEIDVELKMRGIWASDLVDILRDMSALDERQKDILREFLETLRDDAGAAA